MNDPNFLPSLLKSTNPVADAKFDGPIEFAVIYNFSAALICIGKFRYKYRFVINCIVENRVVISIRQSNDKYEIPRMFYEFRCDND